MPLRCSNGKRITEISAPEGKRNYVLFTFAEGGTYSYATDIAIAREYGKCVAQIHTASDDYFSAHGRFRLDFQFLLREPLEQIKPFLQHRPGDWSYICDLCNRIEKAINKLAREGLDTGFCHGDTNGYNAHRTAGGRLSFFDFDFCGEGWRAYDLASFKWLARMNPGEDRWSNFMAGYTEAHKLQEQDLRAVPYLVCARQIWIDGLQIENGDTWGFVGINDDYFDRKLQYLKEAEKDFPG